MKSKKLIGLLFTALFIFVVTLGGNTQEKNENVGKKKVRIKTVKIIDGKKVEKDTTYYLETDNESFSWTTDDGKVIKKDSMQVTVDVEVDEDGEHKQMIFISDDAKMMHLTGDSLHKSKFIVKKIGKSNGKGEHAFFFTDRVGFNHSSALSEIKIDAIEKIEVVTEKNTKTNEPEKVIKVTIKTPEGKTEEKLIRKKLVWTNASAKKKMKIITKDVEVKDDGKVKIYKIKTIDENGNEKQEIKEFKTEGKEDIIWIYEDGEKGEKKNIDVDVKTEGDYKIITIKTTDEDGNEEVKVKKVKISGGQEEDVIILEKEIKEEKKSKDKKKKKEKKK